VTANCRENGIAAAHAASAAFGSLDAGAPTNGVSLFYKIRLIP